MMTELEINPETGIKYDYDVMDEDKSLTSVEGDNGNTVAP